MRGSALFTKMWNAVTCSASSSMPLHFPRFPNAASFSPPPPGSAILLPKQFTTLRCSTGFGAPGPDHSQQLESHKEEGSKSFWVKWKENSAEMSRRMAKLGSAAVLAYGLFDAVTYTSFFVLAFFAYEKSTGKNPAANLQALLGIVIMMWTGNNVTRPFRVAGAAALAPAIDILLRKIQRALKLPNPAYAFGLVVGLVASICFTVAGLLVLSRWGR